MKHYKYNYVLYSKLNNEGICFNSLIELIHYYGVKHLDCLNYETITDIISPECFIKIIINDKYSLLDYIYFDLNNKDDLINYTDLINTKKNIRLLDMESALSYIKYLKALHN